MEILGNIKAFVGVVQHKVGHVVQKAGAATGLLKSSKLSKFAPAGRNIPGPETPKSKSLEIDLPRSEPPKSKSPEIDLPESEPPKSKSPEIDLPGSGPPKFESLEIDLPRPEPPKFESLAIDLPRSEPPKFESLEIDLPRPEPPKFESLAIDLPRSEPPKSESLEIDPGGARAILDFEFDDSVKAKCTDFYRLWHDAKDSYLALVAEHPASPVKKGFFSRLVARHKVKPSIDEIHERFVSCTEELVSALRSQDLKQLYVEPGELSDHILSSAEHTLEFVRNRSVGNISELLDEWKSGFQREWEGSPKDLNDKIYTAAAFLSYMNLIHAEMKTVGSVFPKFEELLAQGDELSRFSGQVHEAMDKHVPVPESEVKETTQSEPLRTVERVQKDQDKSTKKNEAVLLGEARVIMKGCGDVPESEVKETTQSEPLRTVERVQKDQDKSTKKNEAVLLGEARVIMKGCDAVLESEVKETTQSEPLRTVERVQKDQDKSTKKNEAVLLGKARVTMKGCGAVLENEIKEAAQSGLPRSIPGGAVGNQSKNTYMHDEIGCAG